VTPLKVIAEVFRAIASWVSHRRQPFIETLVSAELEAERSYRRMAEDALQPMIRDALLTLAKQEAEHAQGLDVLRQQASMMLKRKDGEAVDDAIREAVSGLHSSAGSSAIAESQLGLFRRAREEETKSRDTYLRLAEEQSATAAREFFLSLAKEEDVHRAFFDDVIGAFARL